MVNHYSKKQLERLNILPQFIGTFRGINLLEADIKDTKFKHVIELIYSCENSVSLCNDVIFNLSERVSPDVAQFVRDWLLKALPSIQAAPDDETAFNNIISRYASTVNDIQPYIDQLQASLQETINNSQPNASNT